ncbi:MAG: Protein TonB [Bacteroidota bacterium]|jgi:protein TonB
MKNSILLLALLAITCSFGQAKKSKSEPKKALEAIEIKEIPYKDKLNNLKADPDGYDTVVAEPGPEINEQDENLIYNVAGIEVKPEFPGGNNKLASYISNNFVYSDEMKEAELKGKVFATFVVERDGFLTDIKIIRGLGYGTEEAVLRILKRMPRWMPGEQNSKKVRCAYSFPITIYATK